MSGTGIDYAELIDRVLGDETAMRAVRNHWDKFSSGILDDRPRLPGSLRVSDAGSCALSLWAQLHDKLDIPDDVHSLDARMQPGILDGTRTACLIAAGLQRWYWPLTAVVEQTVDHGMVPGHADLVVYAEPDPIEVIECKMTFYTKGIEPPEERHKYWIHQACAYANGVGAPNFVVLVHAPAAWNGPTRRSFRYVTDEWATDTNIEYFRLAQATLTVPPEADAIEDWRCKSCRFSQCERNANPLRPTVDTIVDEIGALL